MSTWVLPDEVRGIYKNLRSELIRLSADWKIFRQLYTVDDGRFTIINNTAPGFFRLIQDMLVDDAIIIISRLTDTDKNESLSLLVKLLKNHVKHSLHKELEQDMETLKSTIKDIRKHRNKRVAHSERIDPTPAFKDGPSQLPPLLIKNIEGAISNISEIMNKVVCYFDNPYEIFEPWFGGDADDLIFYLKKGYEASIFPDEVG